MDAIPGLGSLEDLPSGTPVLVRGDVDAKPGPNIGDGDIRLRSMVDTLQFGRQNGWKQIIFGHIGRKPEGSLAKVAKRLGEILECDVPLISDWLDESTTTILPAAAEQIAAAEPGARDHAREHAQVRDRARAVEGQAGRPARARAETRQARQRIREKLGTIYVFEALSAGSLDACSVVVPAAMDRVALGEYVANEFAGPMMRCLDAQLVIFSGLKIDKLDDLEAMINRGKIRQVFAAGSLAMALRKAAAELDGKRCLPRRRRRSGPQRPAVFTSRPPASSRPSE